MIFNVLNSTLPFLVRIFIIIFLPVLATTAEARIVILAPNTNSAIAFANKIASNSEFPNSVINPTSYDNSDIVLTVGNSIFNSVRSGVNVTIAAHISYDVYQRIPPEKRPHYVVFSDPSPTSIRQAIETTFPKVRIGYIHSDPNEPYLVLLKKNGLNFTEFELSDSGIFATLSSLYRRNKPDVMLLSENRDIYNRDSILFILESLYRNRIPVISTNQALINKGSALTVFTTPDHVLEKTIELLSLISRGSPAPQENFPDSQIHVDGHLADFHSIVARSR